MNRLDLQCHYQALVSVISSKREERLWKANLTNQLTKQQKFFTFFQCE